MKETSSSSTVDLNTLRSGNKVLLGDGNEAVVIKKSKNSGVFKDVYQWNVVLGNTTTGELIKESVKTNGVAFKRIDGSLSDYSIASVLK